MRFIELLEKRTCCERDGKSKPEGLVWTASVSTVGPSKFHSISEGYWVARIADRLMEKLRHYKLHFVEANLIKRVGVEVDGGWGVGALDGG